MFFSIITVSYNASALIERTLRSVAAQECRDFEYIIVDGKSSDGTLAIVEKYANVVTHCISEPDNGIYDAMNKGLALAQGQFVWFLNAGDELASPQTLSNVFALAQNADVVFGDTMIVDTDGRELGLRRHRPPQELTWRSFERGMLVCHQAFVARRSLCPSYNLRFRFSADIDWCIRVLRSSTRTCGTQEVLVRFVAGGATAQHKIHSLCERFAVMRRHYGLLRTIKNHIIIAFSRMRKTN